MAAARTTILISASSFGPPQRETPERQNCFLEETANSGSAFRISSWRYEAQQITSRAPLLMAVLLLHVRHIRASGLRADTLHDKIDRNVSGFFKMQRHLDVLTPFEGLF